MAKQILCTIVRNAWNRSDVRYLIAKLSLQCCIAVCSCRCCRTRFMRRFPMLNVPVQSAVCIACFGIALPIAIALFPQITQVS